MRPSILLVLVACGSSPRRDPDPLPTFAETAETPPDPEGATSPGAASPGAASAVEPATVPAGGAMEMRCLPLIGCGCFMQCSMGFFEEPESGEWKVDYYDTRVMAKIEQHCAGGACTDVFAVHTCQKECTPSPLPGTCEIERGPVITCKRRL